MEDRNQAVIYKLFYYYRMTKSYIHNYCCDIDNNDNFPVSIPSPNIWKVSKYEVDDEYCLDTNDNEISDCDFSEILSYIICGY